MKFDCFHININLVRLPNVHFPSRFFVSRLYLCMSKITARTAFGNPATIVLLVGPLWCSSFLSLFLSAMLFLGQMKTLGDLWSVLVVQSGYAPQIEEKNDAKPFCSPFPLCWAGVSEEASARTLSGDRGPAGAPRANLDAEINHLEFPRSPPITPFIGSRFLPRVTFASLLIRFPDRYTI